MGQIFRLFVNWGTFASTQMFGIFQYLLISGKKAAGWALIPCVMFEKQWVLICQVLQPCVGSSLYAACQCLQQLSLCQAYLGGNWARLLVWPGVMQILH